MNYLVIELQTTSGTTANIVTAYSDQNQAEAKFHQIMASAATSNVDTHSAVILNEMGAVVRSEYYKHSVLDITP